MENKKPPEIAYLGNQQIDVLEEEIMEALDIIKEKYGLSELIIDRIYFNPYSFSAKITGKTKKYETENIKERQAKFFALRYGLPEKIIDLTFTMDNITFRIVDIQEKNTKYPIIAHCLANKKDYKFSVAEIKKILGINPTPED
jgi:hypothetical protein